MPHGLPASRETEGQAMLVDPVLFMPGERLSAFADAHPTYLVEPVTNERAARLLGGDMRRSW